MLTNCSQQTGIRRITSRIQAAADKEDTTAAGSISSSFSLDPYDPLKLAGSMISATDILYH